MPDHDGVEQDTTFLCRPHEMGSRFFPGHMLDDKKLFCHVAASPKRELQPFMGRSDHTQWHPQKGRSLPLTRESGICSKGHTHGHTTIDKIVIAAGLAAEPRAAPFHLVTRVA